MVAVEGENEGFNVSPDGLPAWFAVGLSTEEATRTYEQGTVVCRPQRGRPVLPGKQKRPSDVAIGRPGRFDRWIAPAISSDSPYLPRSDRGGQT